MIVKGFPKMRIADCGMRIGKNKKMGGNKMKGILSSRPIAPTPARFLIQIKRAGRSLFPASGTTDIKTFKVSRVGNFCFHKIYMEREPANANKLSPKHDL
jgi:hypothetical protein